MNSLEQVFKKSGIPDVTFVEPKEFPRVSVALRTPGRGIVVEGPSGIGKTSCFYRAIEKENLKDDCLFLSARKPDDIELIKEIRNLGALGTIIIDDFHKLESDIQNSIADFLKILADEERLDSKLILIGINRAGQALINYAPDLVNRIEIIKFGRTNDERIRLLIQKGEYALNCKISSADEIVQEVRGSFAIAQLICHELCIQSEHLQSTDKEKQISASLPSARESILSDLHPRFYPVARDFSTGKKFKKEGRAPYLHLLLWLSQTEDGVLDIKEVLALHQNMKNSVNQVMEKGYLKALLESDQTLSDLIHVSDGSSIVTIEDPKFLYFVRHLMWEKFARQLGYYSLNHSKAYDFALSFAGEERHYAEKIFTILESQDISVFYDQNEQARILGNDLEEYLSPIYRSQARFVVVLLSKDYPKKYWTKFESEQFKDRFGDGCVLPIWFSDVPATMFDETSRKGGISIDVSVSIEDECERVASILSEKIYQERQTEGRQLKLEIPGSEGSV